MIGKITITAILALGIVMTSAQGEQATYLPPPQKQIASGIEAQDVICNSGLTLMLKWTSNSSVCVKSTTAAKLLQLGWGEILKEASEMKAERKAMIAQIHEEKQTYEPEILPSNFVSFIDNKFFTLASGTTFVYEGQTDDGLERIEVSVTDEKRDVMGIKTTVVWDREWLNGELIEDTKDWFAQDKDGTVWYFGEDSKEFAEGKIVSTTGSWEAGIDGAKPGIVMKASPEVGDTYWQEYFPGEAEDQGEVLSIGENMATPYGLFNDCVKIRDFTPLEPDVSEFKYFCAEVGAVVLEEDAEDGEIIQLVNVRTEQVTVEETQAPDISEAANEPTEITEEQAIEIAKTALAGIVTDIGVEYKFGQFAFVVEIQTPEGDEVDVVVDRNTGEILGLDY